MAALGRGRGSLGRTSSFPGEAGKVWNRRDLAVRHGIGEGRQSTQLSRSRRVLRAAGMGIKSGSGRQR